MVGSGLGVIPSFGHKDINKEGRIGGPKDIEDIKQYMDSLVIHFV